MNDFAVRPLLHEDIPHITNYWLNASLQDLEQMGADAGKLPGRDQWRANLEKILETPAESATTLYLIWLVDGHAVGFNSLKNIVHGEQGEMHLHMWDTESRGKGYGGRLFCLAAVEFYRRIRLKTIYCEPRASNPSPNRMLQRIGFPLVKTYTGASSELAMTCELNRYEIKREIAEAYLRSLAR